MATPQFARRHFVRMYGALMLLLMTLLISGCNNCRQDVGATNDRWPPFSTTYMFDGHIQPEGSAWPPTSEEYGRADWPIAQAPQGYVDGGEILTYEDSINSNQYIDSSNKPRQYYHRRLRGYRTGNKYR